MFLPSIDKVGRGKPPANVHGLMKNAYDRNTFGRRQEEGDMLPIKNGSQARMNFVARYPQGWLGNNVVDANSESVRVFLALLTTPGHFHVACNIPDVVRRLPAHDTLQSALPGSSQIKTSAVNVIELAIKLTVKFVEGEFHVVTFNPLSDGLTESLEF